MQIPKMIIWANISKNYNFTKPRCMRLREQINKEENKIRIWRMKSGNLRQHYNKLIYSWSKKIYKLKDTN